MLIGKHRNIFAVSPKKSLEGFLAGILFAFIGAYVLYLCFRGVVDLKLLYLGAVAAGLFGQFGDLAESLLKRDIGVKDSSNIIPGHGGMLDRFDSFIVAAPVFYALVYFFQ